MTATEAPNPYVIRRVNKWIEADAESDLAGLAIKVRQYITNAERDDLVEASNAIRLYSAEYMTLDLEQRAAAEAEKGGTPRDLEWQLLAPYIIEWNVKAENEAGEIVDVPAPADGGADVFALIPNEHYSWMYDVVIRGYRAMGKAGSFSAA
jgi:hypothetical protein